MSRRSNAEPMLPVCSIEHDAVLRVLLDMASIHHLVEELSSILSLPGLMLQALDPLPERG